MLPAEELYTAVISTALLMLLLVLVILVAIAKYFKKKREYESIEELLQKQELKSAYSVIEAQEIERKRVASEVHDNIGSLLATLKMYSDLAITKVNYEELKPLTNRIDFIATSVTDEVRRIAHNLDSSTLTNFGLKVAIEQLCEAINSSGRIKVDCIIDLRSEIQGDSVLNIYRIVQELFTNTLKHSNADKVRFEITQLNGDLTIIHEDNGIGFDTHKGFSDGIGFQNIKARIAKLNGELKITSSPQTGATFIIEIHQ